MGSKRTAYGLVVHVRGRKNDGSVELYVDCVEAGYVLSNCIGLSPSLGKKILRTTVL